MKKGGIVKGKVTGIKEYGAFIKVDNYDGLVHISEFSDEYIRNINDIVKIGDELELKIIDIDDSHRLRLSYKAVNDHEDALRCVLNVKKGFTTLEEHLDDWIENEYQRLIVHKNN